MRAEIHHDDRDVLVEAAIRVQGRNRIMANKQSVTRRRDLAEHLRVTVFAPDDLALVKGAPAGRRDFVDDLLVASTPRLAGVITDYERVIKQRTHFRAGHPPHGRPPTREVLDPRLVSSGAALIDARLELIARLAPAVRDADASLAGDAPGFATRVRRGVERARARPRGRSGKALTEARARLGRREEDRGATLVGPPARLDLRARRHRRAASRVAGRAAHARARAASRGARGGRRGRGRAPAPARRRLQRARRRRAAALVAHLPGRRRS